MSNANDLATPGVGATTIYEGNTTNWGGASIIDESSQPQIPYTGPYMVSFGGTVVTNNQNAIAPTTVTGYNIGYGATITINIPVGAKNDLDPVAPHPKNQTIFFKLSGFNPQTQQLENWVISEEIVVRPELFDPTRSPPNVDFGIFTTPPSGHALTNIKIVARWIQ
jgi:hypothetical protein